MWYLKGKCPLCISQTLFFHNVQRYCFFQSINNINRRKSVFLIKKVIICDLEWPLRSCLDFIENFHLHNVSIHRKFYQNRFINECVRKKQAKIPESRSPGIFEWDINEVSFLIKLCTLIWLILVFVPLKLLIRSKMITLVL